MKSSGTTTGGRLHSHPPPLRVRARGALVDSGRVGGERPAAVAGWEACAGGRLPRGPLRPGRRAPPDASPAELHAAASVQVGRTYPVLPHRD